MGLIEGLKSFFEGAIKLPALKTLVDLKNINLRIIDIKNSPLITIDKSVKSIDNSIHLTLNVGSAEVKDIAAIESSIHDLLNDYVQNQHKPVLEEVAAETLVDINASDKYQDQIKYFRGKIPESDLLILRAAYYLRSVHEAGGQVRLLKDGITQRYGWRGSNVSNLCSAGYFESYIQPLYEELSKRNNFTEQMFLENYELIVRDFPFAFFVSNHHSLDSLVKEVADKLQFGRRYGLHELTIHTIGRENIAKVLQLLDHGDIKALAVEDIDTDIRNNVMTATIRH